MPKIRQLNLSGFRGIRNNLSLLFEGKSVLLFGENGTGKSSFVDALEKLFTGKISTLDGRAQSLSSDRHGPHIHNANSQIAVVFNDLASTTLTLSSNHIGLPVEIQQYVDSARENLYILRRRQILDFIDSQPRDRYALLRPFLPLSGIESIETALKIVLEKIEAAARETKQEYARLATELNRELGITLSSQAPSEREVVEQVAQALERVGQTRVNQIQAFGSSLSALDTSLSTFGDLTRQTRISNVVTLLAELYDSIPSTTLKQFENALTKLREREAQEAGLFYEAVLEEGSRWIEEEHRRTCPLCENPVHPEEIVIQIRRRLEVMKLLLDLRRETQEALEQIRQTFRSFQHTVERTRQELASMAEEDKGKCQELLEELSVLLAKAKEALASDLRTIRQESVREIGGVIDENSGFHGRITAEQRRLEYALKALPSAEVARRLLSTRDMIFRVMETWSQIQSIQSTITNWEQRVQIARKLFDSARSARKEEVQRIFDELSEDVSRIYTALHPDESHGGIRLEVREVGQGSAHVKVKFYEREDEDPRAYYSEAHLDTLGLGLFLALRRWYRKQRPDFDLLVLDDVLTSVDTHHAIRISELLLQEFQDYQILLTTHDRIWFEHLRDIQARCRVSNSFINKIIHKWTLDEGPDIREPEEERRELDRLISDGSAEHIASLAGRLLEHILQEMRYSLRLSVQAKRGEQYEIGDLWPGFYTTIKRDYPKLYESARTAVEALDVTWPLRNWVGAHRNTWARNIQRKTGVEFANSVANLFDHVFCSACRRFVSPSATPLGQLACRCGERIYPASGKEGVKPRTREELIRETAGALRDARLDTNLYLAWKRAETEAEREH